MADDKEKAANEAPAAEAPSQSKPLLTEKDLKKVPKPDEALLKEKIAAEDAKVVALQARLTAIKESLDSHESGRGEPNSELAIAKSKYNEIRQESRRLQQEKRNIYDQISAADELKKQQQDLVQRLRNELTYFSVEEIERKIKGLELQQQTSSLTIKEDKKVMEEIKRLSANKPMIKQYDEAQESLKGVREHHNNLYTQLKAKTAELVALKEVEDKHRAEVDEVKSKEEAKRSDIPGLFKERDSIRAKVSEHRDTIKKIRDEFNEQRREYITYQKALREIRNREYQEQKAARAAYYEEERKRREEELAKRDPWEEEKLVCEQLISWVGKYLPKKVEEKEESKPVEVPQGVKLLKGKSALEEEVDPFAVLIKKKKGKGGKGPAGAPPKPKSVKIALGPEDFAIFEKLGFKAPAETGDCPALYEQLLEKREWLKTAPPKPKKVAKAKEEAPADAPSAEAPAFDEAEDLKKKQEDLARKAAEAAAAEELRIKRALELESSGKKAAGGLHKFDASEVDVHGGSATADDFLGAFGFDEEGAAEEGAAEEEAKAPEAAPAFDEAEDLKKKQDDLARKAAEAAAAEELRVKRALELESSGKKAAGGLHKFDASEVDVHGGSATADDFLGAFGFDEEGAAEEGAAEEEAKAPEAAPAFDEAEDLKKKQDDLARKAAEAAAAEELRVKRALELESSGKKAAGGLHKFDASEVDVHGGSATADDFMDAFGFDEEGGAAEDCSTGAAAPAAATNGLANGAQEMISIQALSESQVKVALHI